MDAFDILGGGGGASPQPQQQQQQQVGNIVNGQYIPAQTEKFAFDQLFDIADVGGAGSIGGRDAVMFLKKSGLPNPILKEIWNIAVVDAPEMSREQFYTVMRLIGTCQMGRPLNQDTLAQSANEYVAVPRFVGVQVTPAPSGSSTTQQPQQGMQQPQQGLQQGMQQPQQGLQQGMQQPQQGLQQGMQQPQQGLQQGMQQPQQGLQQGMQQPQQGLQQGMQQQQQPQQGMQHQQQPRQGLQQGMQPQQHQQGIQQGMSQQQHPQQQGLQQPIQATSTGASWASIQQQQQQGPVQPIQSVSTGTSWASLPQQQPQQQQQQQPRSSVPPPIQAVVEKATVLPEAMNSDNAAQLYSNARGAPALHESMAALHQLLLQSTERVKNEIAQAQGSLANLNQERTELLSSLTAADQTLQSKIADLARLDQELGEMRGQVSGLRRQVQEKSLLVQETEEKIIRKQAEALSLQQQPNQQQQVQPQAVSQPVAQAPAVPSDPYLAGELSRANGSVNTQQQHAPMSGGGAPPAVPARSSSPPKPPARATPAQPQQASSASPFDVGFEAPTQNSSEWSDFGNTTVQQKQQSHGNVSPAVNTAGNGAWDSFGSDTAAFPDDSAAFDSPNGAAALGPNTGFEAFDANFDESFDFGGGNNAQ